MAQDAPLTRIEKLALRIGELANEDPRGKWIQTKFLRGVSYVWVRKVVARRIFAEGLDEVIALRPKTGVMLVANHRSFFDSYILLLACYMGRVPWAKSLQFPVRSNFFYDSPLGIAINAAIAGGAMYPPIFRQAERRALNDEALDRMVEILKRPGAVLGMHPEGTRGKGADPYQLLPAQPGVGKAALLAQPMVVPAFINGLGNNLAEDVRINFTKEARRSKSIIAVFGPPIDYTDLMAEKPRPTLYKKCADRFMAEVKKLSEKERALRAEIEAGRIDEHDVRWLENRDFDKFYAREGHE
ncbi:MAG: phospholipid/glycerol acyltransferase [Myxococcales bacterium]|nr:phospholipid/glycerol acyltransferase [Myxococcales bacterium]